MKDKNLLITISNIESEPDMTNIEKLFKKLRVLEFLLFTLNTGEIKEVNEVLSELYYDIKMQLISTLTDEIRNVIFGELDDEGNILEVDETKRTYDKGSKQ